MARQTLRLCTLLFLLALATAGPGTAMADAGFTKWLNSFRPVAAKAGVTKATFNAAFAGVTAPDAETIEKMGRQAEFTKKVWEYLDAAVSEAQVRNGQEMRRKYAAQLANIEKRYGVDADVVLAVWGIETRYGAKMGDHNVIHALATLAYAAPRRKEFWTRELINALKIVQAGHIAPKKMIGSWAGAMGHTQFMPSSWKGYAADYEGDGKRDIWTNIPDALASTANYLADHGWRTGEAWGYEVVLPKGFNRKLVDKDGVTIGEWQKMGVKRASGAAFPRAGDKAVLKQPGGANGAAFLVLKNFYVIKRYNNSDFYALAVGHLADRIAGGKEFIGAWPRGYEPLNETERKQVQQILSKLGYYEGEIDGAIGSGSKASIMAYQASAGLTPDGHPSKELLKRLKSR
ncbi:MAG TPA: lytic murein transglycosylase [Rhizobiaceae bacterium]|nr:lytic murein transglycosylase [Rhizobiaceae bacterium]